MAITADMIQLPVDTGNAGKKKRTRTRTIGTDVVHEDFVVLSSARDYGSKPLWESDNLTIPAAVQNGTTTGLVWLFNPIGSGKKIGIDRITISDQFTALAVDLVAGNISVNRFTYTGTPSGAALTPAARDSTDAAAVGSARTASTGMTVTLGARLYSKQTQTMDLVTGGAGHWCPDQQEFMPESDDAQVILREGEGIVFWSSIAVTTGNRRCVINGMWEEFTDPA